MRHANSCIESLERRMLLNAAIEVWAGNTNPGNLSFDQGIEELGYTRIGESNRANASVAFNSSTSYKYFVIATRGRVKVDSIRNSAGTYVSQIADWSNVVNPSAATGASNNVYATVGTATWGSSAGYAGHMLVVAPSTWQGITVKTGTVEPMFELRVELTANYMQGASTPYGYRAELKMEHNGLITSARVHTPAGRWFDLSSEGEGGGERMEFKWESFYGTKSAMDAEFGEGIYTVYLGTTLGATSYAFNASGLSFPTQIPSTTSLKHGKLNTPTTLDIALPAITDGSVTNVSMWISSSNEDEVYNSYFTPGSGSLEQVVLAPAESYNASLRFGADKRIWTSDGYGVNYQKSNEIGMVFATTGFTQGTPDLQGNSFTAAPATLNPGDSFMLSLSVSSTGGIVTSPQQPLTYLMGLSTNKIIGDADDVILFAPVDVGTMANWQFAGDMSVRIPDTATPGQYFVFGFLDATNVVAEASETNNIAWSSSAVVTIRPQGITLDPSSHNLNVVGTAGDDSIAVQLDAQTIHATLNGVTRSFSLAEVAGIYINADAGDDAIELSGALPAPLIYGGAGNDIIIGSAGNDIIYGNTGDDRIFAGGGNDSVYGGLGADSIEGGAGNDSLIGGDQSDTIRGDDGDDYIEGKGKADIINGNGGNDVIIAGAGNDSVYAGLGADYIDGNGGNDSLIAGNESDTVYGGDGDDYIEGKGKADTLYGGAGNDTIVGGSGSNAIYGEDGDDRIYALNSLSFRDTISGGTGTDGAQRESNDVLSSIEQNILV